MYATAKNMLKEIVTHYDRFTLPKHIAARFRHIDQSGLDVMKYSLEQQFFSRFPEGYLSTDYGRRDMANHLVGRLDNDRSTVIPWLNSARTLQDCNILEIGCGTGCSTVALAEQGARVVGVDMDESALKVAAKRCEVYGLDVDFRLANAVDVHKLFSGRRFDFVIFYASLEHMLYEERLSAIKTTWDMLSPNDLYCIVETPNRLWCYDSHTSHLPFFSWLPDELAFKYARFSPRKDFRERYGEYTENMRLDFLRRGRGVSFHEFHLAIGCPVEQLNVLTSLGAYCRRRNVLRRLQRRPTLEVRFQALLAEMYPELHRGWFQPSLDLVIKK